MKDKGFSLVELVIVSAIIILLAAVVIVILRQSNERSNLRFAAQNLASVLKQAQAAALSGKENNGAVPDSYGVYISTANSYIFFGDDNGDDNYDSGEEAENIDLPEGVVFSDGSDVGKYILFRIPSGEMWLTGSVSQLTINLALSGDLTQSNFVYLRSAAGLIEVQD